MHAGRIAMLRGDLDAAGVLGERALGEMDPADHTGRAWAHLHLGTLDSERQEWHRARRQLRTALIEARCAGDLRLTARVLNNLGTLSGRCGNSRDAERRLEAVFTIGAHGVLSTALVELCALTIPG